MANAAKTGKAILPVPLLNNANGAQMAGRSTQFSRPEWAARSLDSSIGTPRFPPRSLQPPKLPQA